MPKRDTHRVMSHQDGWQVKRDGDQRPSHVTETKKEAERLARAISQHQCRHYYDALTFGASRKY